MPKLSLKEGSTSVDVNVFIQDSSSTTGAGLTGLVFNSTGLVAYYHRQGAASAVAITLATKTVGTWATGGFIAVDGTNMPGVYEVGIPNAALATGADWVVIMLRGATNMAPLVLEVELTAVDNQDAVRGGMTALPNFNAGVASGLPVLDSALLVDADLERVKGTVINALVANRMDSSVGAIATGAITAAAFAAGAIDAAAIATGAIDADAIAAAAITAAKFAAGAVDAAALAADAANEIRDAVWTQAMTEATAVPSVTGTMKVAIEWLLVLSRNRVTQTATTQTLRNDANTVNIATSAISDDGTTFERAEWA